MTHHALCWAHPLRKFRDLSRSRALSLEHRRQCKECYEHFHLLERSVASIVASPFVAQQRMEEAEQLRGAIHDLMTNDTTTLAALERWKKTFLANTERYLVCVLKKDVPMTNNKAERSVRPLVIKRLLSFGSRSQNGVRAMETLLSVCFTLWWSQPKDYFTALRALMVRG